MGKLSITCIVFVVVVALSNKELELWNAVTEENLALVNNALDLGTDPNWHNTAQYGRTVLHLVAKNNNVDIARALVSAGADPNLQDNGGIVPLDEAAYYGSPDVIPILLSHGAIVNIRSNDGVTPLMKAADYGKLSAESVQLLINSNANVNLVDNLGRTALHWLAYNNLNKNKLDLATLLMQNGADPKKKDKQGRTSAALAREKGLTQLANIIENFDVNSILSSSTNAPTAHQTKAITISPITALPEEPYELSVVSQTIVACAIVLTIAIVMYLIVKCHVARRSLKREAQLLQEPRKEPRISIREAVHFDNTRVDNDTHIYNVADPKGH